MTDYIWRAYCAECGITKEQGVSVIWLDDFFLGRGCDGCGSVEKYIVEIGRWDRDVSFELFKISTWKSSFTWVEK
jgi:hypothetical protein